MNYGDGVLLDQGPTELKLRRDLGQTVEIDRLHNISFSAEAFALFNIAIAIRAAEHRHWH